MDVMEITIKVNGAEEQVEKCNLLDFLKTKTEELDSLIVEYNYEILISEKWEVTTLNNGDNLELLSFVGGG